MVKLSAEQKKTTLKQAEVHASMAEMELDAIEQLFKRAGVSPDISERIEILRKHMIKLMLEAHQNIVNIKST